MGTVRLALFTCCFVGLAAILSVYLSRIWWLAECSDSSAVLVRDGAKRIVNVTDVELAMPGMRRPFRASTFARVSGPDRRWIIIGCDDMPRFDAFAYAVGCAALIEDA